MAIKKFCVPTMNVNFAFIAGTLNPDFVLVLLGLYITTIWQDKLVINVYKLQKVYSSA